MSSTFKTIRNSEDQEVARLHRDDCLAVLPSVPEVDLIIADPPYGMDFQSQRKKDKSDWKPKIANDKRPFVWWLHYAAMRLKEGGALICFCRWDSWGAFSDACDLAGLTVKNQIVWDKMNHTTGDLKGSPGTRHEIAVFAVKGRFTFPGKRPQTLGAFKKVSPAKLQHPNEKPVELMEWLVQHYSAEGETVLDPFTGVSPVGVACANTNRNFIGIELDENYFQVAKDRIEQAFNILGVAKDVAQDSCDPETQESSQC